MSLAVLRPTCLVPRCRVANFLPRCDQPAALPLPAESRSFWPPRDLLRAVASPLPLATQGSAFPRETPIRNSVFHIYLCAPRPIAKRSVHAVFGGFT